MGQEESKQADHDQPEQDQAAGPAKSMPPELKRLEEAVPVYVAGRTGKRLNAWMVQVPTTEAPKCFVATDDKFSRAPQKKDRRLTGTDMENEVGNRNKKWKASVKLAEQYLRFPQGTIIGNVIEVLEPRSNIWGDDDEESEEESESEEGEEGEGEDEEEEGEGEEGEEEGDGDTVMTDKRESSSGSEAAGEGEDEEEGEGEGEDEQEPKQRRAPPKTRTSRRVAARSAGRTPAQPTSGRKSTQPSSAGKPSQQAATKANSTGRAAQAGNASTAKSGQTSGKVEVNPLLKHVERQSQGSAGRAGPSAGRAAQSTGDAAQPFANAAQPSANAAQPAGGATEPAGPAAGSAGEAAGGNAGGSAGGNGGGDGGEAAGNAGAGARNDAGERPHGGTAGTATAAPAAAAAAAAAVATAGNAEHASEGGAPVHGKRAVPEPAAGPSQQANGLPPAQPVQKRPRLERDMLVLPASYVATRVLEILQGNFELEQGNVDQLRTSGSGVVRGGVARPAVRPAPKPGQGDEAGEEGAAVPERTPGELMDSIFYGIKYGMQNSGMQAEVGLVQQRLLGYLCKHAGNLSLIHAAMISMLRNSHPDVACFLDGVKAMVLAP